MTKKYRVIAQYTPNSYEYYNEVIVCNLDDDGGWRCENNQLYFGLEKNEDIESYRESSKDDFIRMFEFDNGYSKEYEKKSNGRITFEKSETILPTYNGITKHKKDEMIVKGPFKIKGIKIRINDANRKMDKIKELKKLYDRSELYFSFLRKLRCESTTLKYRTLELVKLLQQKVESQHRRKG